jgi:hypothetical protein
MLPGLCERQYCTRVLHTVCDVWSVVYSLMKAVVFFFKYDTMEYR